VHWGGGREHGAVEIVEVVAVGGLGAGAVGGATRA
jgi:hypothetical protein